MVTLSTQVSIQNRTGTTLSTVSLASFWSATGATGVFGPRVIYDPYGSRWIFTAASDFSSAASSILVGVSTSTDPTSTWNLYRFDADSLDLGWADFPAMGFNKDWIVVSSNMWANADNSFQGSRIFAIRKSDLYSGVGSPYTKIFDDNGPAPTPALTYDNTLAAVFLVKNVSGDDGGGNGYLQISTFSGSPGAENYTPNAAFVVVASTWAFSPPSFADFAPQSGISAKIQTDDATLTNVVYRSGSLWTAQNAFLPSSSPTRVAAQWWQFTPGGTVQKFGRVDDPTNTVFYAYPSIAVNAQGDAMLGYSRFSASTFASAGYTANAFNDTAMRDPVILKPGEATYVKLSAHGHNHWGDYSATVVDPVNDMDFWTIQEYASSPNFSNGHNRWGTWWGKINPPPPVGTISWENRKASDNTLQGGATFTVTGASGPSACIGTLTNPITVVDNGANDADPTAGEIHVVNVCLGTYTITETAVPSGWAPDSDTTRAITVSLVDLNAVVGTQGVNDPGSTDESDFHNRLGSLSWENRAATDNTLQGGATFTVGGASGPFACAGTSTNPITVVDNGTNDANPAAGQIQVNNVCLGTYTITETVTPAGWAPDTDTTRAQTINLANLNAVVGTQGADDPGTTDESDFHNRLGSLAWESRKASDNTLQGGATFTVSPNPLTGSGTLTIVDGDGNDATAAAGQIQINNVLLGSYTITETIAPAGWAPDSDPTRAQTVNVANLNAVVGTQGVDDPGTTDESDFHNRLTRRDQLVSE
jgi:hypothetical protein